MRLRQIADPTYKTKHGLVRAVPLGKFQKAVDDLDFMLTQRSADAQRLQPLLAKVSETGETYIAAQFELDDIDI